MNKAKSTHPFGGCNKLLHQYKVIGHELLQLEKRSAYSIRSDVDAFRQGLAFVTVETLESYLEDVLDLEVSDESLFIVRDSALFRSFVLPLGGLLLSLCIGLYAASSGASLVLAFGLTICLAMPFFVLWHYSPRSGLMRRMNFAHVLSHEISRRRGNDKDMGSARASQLVLQSFLGRKAPGSAQGAAFLLH